jgi:hypothetical protein
MKIISNVWTQQDIATLIDFYASQPLSNQRFLDDGRLWRNMKNTDYNIKDSLPYRVLNQKLIDNIGQHCFNNGHYLDSHWPFSLHIDAYGTHAKANVPQFGPRSNAGLACMIPLSEGPHFQTLFFDYYADDWQKSDIQKIAEHHGECLSPSVLESIDHHSQEQIQKIKYLTLDAVAHWELGSLVVWDRRQLHCSSNFAKYGLTKQAIVLFL